MTRPPSELGATSLDVGKGLTAPEDAEIDAALDRSATFHRELVATLIDAHNRMVLLAIFGPKDLLAGASTRQRRIRERRHAAEIRRDAVAKVERRLDEHYPGMPEPLLELTLLRVIRDASLQSAINLAGRKNPPKTGPKPWSDTLVLFSGSAWPWRLRSLRSARFQTVGDIRARALTYHGR